MEPFLSLVKNTELGTPWVPEEMSPVIYRKYKHFI